VAPGPQKKNGEAKCLPLAGKHIAIPVPPAKGGLKCAALAGGR